MGKAKIYPVVLCGGSGTRLWPLSRKSMPKQFADILGEHTLFQTTCLRFANDHFASPTIVTNENFRFTVKDELSQIQIPPEKIILEPQPKNSAPAVLLAVLGIAEVDKDAFIIVLPSDAAIENTDGFLNAVKDAAENAKENQILTFGIEPNAPETGYGYLEVEGKDYKLGEIQSLRRFVEKPDLQTAQSMLDAGNYLWNAGIFLARAETLISAYKTFAPEIFEAVSKSHTDSSIDLGFTRPNAEAWSETPADSIDYAIMEKYGELAVMPVDIGWSDLGDWQSVWNASPRNKNGVASRGSSVDIDCKNTLLRSEEESMTIVGVGLEEVFAVATKDAVVIGKMDKAQDVKKAVSEMKARNISQAEQSLRDYRPWGWYETLVMGPRFQVKRIVVNPGAALSLQSHYHRAEHWTVVEGSATVTIDDEVKLVGENQSVYVPLGAIHRLENPGKVPLTLIEVQSGSYLGEDDIVRYEDKFGRS